MPPSPHDARREVFLREHASVHVRAVGDAPYGVDSLLEGLDEAAWRARPHGLNSLAWLLWHIASVEDTHVAPVVFGAPPLPDAALAARLGVDLDRAYAEGRRDVDELSARVVLAELRAYRDAVGRRTRALALARNAGWTDPIVQADLDRGARAGHLGANETYLLGRPRDALLHWWAVSHSAYHLGQMALLRRVLGVPAE